MPATGRIAGVFMSISIPVLPGTLDVLKFLLENPVSEEELLQMSALLDRIGPMDFNLLAKTFGPLGDILGSLASAPKKFAMSNLIEQLKAGGLIVEREGKLEVTVMGRKFLSGVESWGEFKAYFTVQLLPGEDGSYHLKPQPGIVYFVEVAPNEPLVPGLYYVEPECFLAVHERITLYKGNDNIVIPIHIVPTTIRIPRDCRILLYPIETRDYSARGLTY